MERIKGYLLDVLISKGGPSAIRGAILGIGGYLVAKSGVLSTFGVAYDAANHIITVNLDTLNIALVALLPAAGAVVVKILNYHAAAGVSAVMPSAALSQTPPQEPKP